MNSSPQTSHQIDIQGHRGCRGILPENTIPAFIKAIDIGVHTLELDVVISKDKQVVVSHEPFFNHEISLTPDGQEISEEEEKEHNLFQMTYEEISRYDVGQRPHPRFPDQTNMALHKPLLKDVIAAAEAHAASIGAEPLYYNIETKIQPAGDNIFHPGPEEFVNILMGVIVETGIMDRAIIQSFDPRTLQYLHDINPEIVLALLIENEEGMEANLARLGFVPQIYSPYFIQVDEKMMKDAKTRKMKVIPWTLNEESDIQKMIDLGVDGIISDYPDKVVRLLANNSEK